MAHDKATASANRRLPPPIDPAVFRGSIKIRRLVEAASELSCLVRTCADALVAERNLIVLQADEGRN